MWYVLESENQTIGTNTFTEGPWQVIDIYPDTVEFSLLLAINHKFRRKASCAYRFAPSKDKI